MSRLGSFFRRWLGEERLPLTSALIEPWAYTEDGDLSRWAKLDNAWLHLTRFFRWRWWSCMLERPAQTAERRGTGYLTVVLCRIRGHAPRIFYNPGGMEPDDRCSRCLEPY